MSTIFKNIVNRFNTTIKAASSINNTDDPVTFNITDATGIPAVPFYFTVEQLTDSSVFERMLATAVDGDEIVATRAQDGSSKQTFAAGDLVQIRVIAAHIDEPTAAINTLEGHIDQGVKVADGPTFANLTLSGLTASELTATDGDKKLQSLAVATYPSLTEVSYIKGLSSAIQTQLAGKAAVDQTMYIGTTAVNIDRASATLNLAGIGTLACGAITTSTDITSTLGGGALKMGYSDADDTTKSGIFSVQHYDTAEQPFYALYAISYSTANVLELGGGSSGANAATLVRIRTAANNSTTTGTVALSIDSSQDVTLSALSGNAGHYVKVDADGKLYTEAT